MQIKQLEYFVKTVECGSITQAAQQLYVSQPSLTKAILSLEQEYGEKFLVRKARGVELTPQGKNFMRYAKGVLTAAQALETNFSGAQKQDGVHLSVAAQQLDFTYEILAKVLAVNSDRQYHYSLMETNRNDVVRLVLEGAADLGMFVRSEVDAKSFLWHTEAKRLDQHVVDTSSVYICVGPLSKYYNRDAVTFGETECCRQIVLDMEEQASQELYFDQSSNHYNTKQITFCNTVSACEYFLLHTDAIAYCSRWTIRCFQNPEIRAIRVMARDAAEVIPYNELVWLKRAGEPLSPAEGLFLSLLYRQFSKTMPDLKKAGGREETQA